MVGHEADRAHHHRGGTLGRHPVHLDEEVGSDPRVGRATGALPRRTPGDGGICVEFEPRRHVDPGLGHLVGIGVAHGHDPQGQAVGGEEHRRRRAGHRVETVECGPRAGGQELGEALDPVP